MAVAEELVEVELDFTAELIARARPRSIRCCLVALAFEAAGVDSPFVGVWNWQYGKSRSLPLDETLSATIEDFVAGKVILPFKHKTLVPRAALVNRSA